MFPFFPNNARNLNRKFKENYRCISFNTACPDRAARLENGGKIILPASALERLTRLLIEYPMLFQLKTKLENGETHKTHCGVLEFIAPEGYCFAPTWMMKQLGIKEGDILSVKSVTLPRGTFVRFQPHQKAFLEISNPKAVLERELGLEVKYAALTKGDAIPIQYLGRVYYISVLEVQPENPNDAISIIETDINVDFAPALDDVVSAPARQESTPGTPLGTSPAITTPSTSFGTSPADAKPTFQAFAGSGYRLDGKPIRPDSNPRMSTSPATSSSSSSSSSSSTSSSIPTTTGFRTAGNVPTPAPGPSNRLVFGGGPSSAPVKAAAPAPAQSTTPQKEEPKFVPFSGQGYRLR